MAAYRNSEHFAKAFAVFNVMRKFVTSLHFVHMQAILTSFFFYRANYLCDVVLLTTNQQEFPAHKAVLASCSPYFHAMFDRFDESHQERIVLQDIDPKALGLLLDFLYTSQIQISEQNAQVLILLYTHSKIKP